MRKQILIFSKRLKVRLRNKPEMTVCVEVTMNTVMSWKSKRTKNVRNMQQLKIIGMNVIISIYFVSTW